MTASRTSRWRVSFLLAGSVTFVTFIAASVVSCSSKPTAEEPVVSGGDAGFVDPGATSLAEAGSVDGALPEGGRAAVCSAAKTWGNATRLTLATPEFAHFSGTSPDGLTVAWRVTGGDLYVTDRAFVGGAFSTPVFANDYGGAPDYAPDDRITLSSDGRSLVGATDDGLGFGVMTRGEDGKWSNGDTSPFDALKAQLANLAGAPSSPVLGSSGKTFFFLVTPASGAPALYESAWDPGTKTWRAAIAVPNPELASQDATHRRRPTGVSSDDRTLFYFDEVAGIERAALRAATSGAFASFVDVGAFSEAAPLFSCDALLFQGGGGSGPGIFTAQ